MCFWKHSESLKSSWLISFAQSQAMLSLAHRCQIKLISDHLFTCLSAMNSLHAGGWQAWNLFLDRPSLLLSVWVIVVHKLFQSAVRDFWQSAEMSALTSGWNDVMNWGQRSENLQNVIKYFHQFIAQKMNHSFFFFFNRANLQPYRFSKIQYIKAFLFSSFFFW